MPISPDVCRKVVATVATDLASGANRRIIAEELAENYALTSVEVNAILADARALPKPAATER